VYVEIAKSPNDSFQVTMKKTARGNTRSDANSLANLIKFDAVQKDSILLLEKGIAINKTDKFRNQMFVITIYVPVGKQVRVNKGIGWPVHFGSDRWDDNWDNDYYDGEQDIRWQSDVDYIMKEDGLYTLTGKKADGWNDKKENSGNKRNNRSNNNDDQYRYNEYDKKADSLRNIEEIKRQNKIDSIDKAKEKLDSIKAKIENAKLTDNEPGPLSSLIMPGVDILPNI
jgi:hypothetical protein